MDRETAVLLVLKRLDNTKHNTANIVCSKEKQHVQCADAGPNEMEAKQLNYQFHLLIGRCLVGWLFLQ